MAKKSVDIIALMQFYGVEFSEVSKKGEHVADCFKCEKEKHLYVNESKQCYICHKCGTTGTVKDFLGFLWNHFENNITSAFLQELADYRRVPLDVFLTAKVGYFKGKYFFPVLLDNKDITDLRYVSMGQKVHSSPGVITGLYYGELLFDKERKSDTVYICEGEFDCLVLNHILRTLKIAGFAISLPGANNFKSHWAPLFIDRKVVCCLDNDSAGKEGTQKIKTLIGKGVTKSLEMIKWPDDFPPKYDISDFFVAYAYKENKLKEAWDLLSNLIVPADAKEQLIVKYDIQGTVTFPQLIEHYEKFLDIAPDFKTLIKVCVATALSGAITKADPVWIFIVGPPGYGKTAVLSSFKQAENCFYQSTLSRHNLVSGFKTMDGSDPSILGSIGNRCLILKDYTEILTKARTDRIEISGILRGAFDGSVERDFGNGVKRRYETNFPLLAGVTDAIKHFSDAELGERMLRFNLNVDGIDFMKQGEQALLSSITGDEARNELQQYVAYYMSQNFDITNEALLHRSTPEFRRRVIPLAKLVAHLRTKVVRHDFGVNMHNVSYRPRAEAANRLSIQLNRLALSLSYVEGESIITSQIYKLIKRIAFDTIEGYTTDICKFLNNCHTAVQRDVLTEALTIPRSSITYFLEDLETIGAITKSTESNGLRKVMKYKLSPQIKDLWSRII